MFLLVFYVYIQINHLTALIAHSNHTAFHIYVECEGGGAKDAMRQTTAKAKERSISAQRAFSFTKLLLFFGF